MQASVTAPIFSRNWLWLFPPAYLVHLLDERFFGNGTAAWATAHMGVYLTNDAWLIINVVWFLLLTLSTWLVSPGVVSGVTICLPWAVITFARGFRLLPLRQFVSGLVFGALSLQPLWDFLMLPVLSPRPPAA